MNKQIRALISWAKKYMDCDGLLLTDIEGKPVKIQNTWLYSQQTITMDIYVEGDIEERHVWKDESWKKVMDVNK